MFRPSILATATIERELYDFLEDKGIVRGNYGIAVRTPEEHVYISDADDDVRNWHRDGNEYPNSPVTPTLHYIVVWSNGTPTRLAKSGDASHKPTSDDFWEIGAGHVLLVDNIEMWHKCPPPEPNRWFARFNEPILPIGFLE